MDSQNYRSYVNMNQKLIRKIDVHALEIESTFENAFKAIKSKFKLKKKKWTHNTHHNSIKLLRSWKHIEGE
jgi:hypothetical protein